MKKPLLLSFIIIGCAWIAYGQEIPLEQWSHNHPEASVALGNWVKNHPPAAHQLFEWDANHPERSQELVNWAITHPREHLEVFMAEHRGWREVEIFTRRHAAAMEDFLLWCRNHAIAAKALMAHSAALAWAGDHLYKEYMNMETPAKR